MKVRPIKDRVLIELDAFERNFGDSKLIRPDIAFDKPLWGTVRGVGPGAHDKKGRFIPTTVRPGDRVYVPPARGHDLHIGGRFCIMVKESDIDAIEAQT